MNSKVRKLLKENFSNLEQELIRKYFALCLLDDAICDVCCICDIHNQSIDNAFDYVRNVKIKMYENNASMMRLINKYKSIAYRTL